MKNKDINILIVDDERVLAYVIQEMLYNYDFNNTLVAKSYDTAIEKMKENEIQLAILDINLGAGPTGIQLAKFCSTKQIPFFYLSSHTDTKTLDLALKTMPGGYVVKPVTPASLYSAINIIFNQNNKEELYYSFKDGIKTVRIRTKDIFYFKADGVYVEAITLDKNYLIRKSLSDIYKTLPSHEFIQVHRSYVVNINLVDSYTSTNIRILNFEIPLSRKFREECKRRFQV